MQSWGPWVFLPELSPDSPEVIEEALLQLGQQQGDGRLRVHGDETLARAQGGITHKLVLDSEGLCTQSGGQPGLPPQAPAQVGREPQLSRTAQAPCPAQ